jgi:hypothetical protein
LLLALGITISSVSNNPNKNKKDKTMPLEIKEDPITIFIELFFFRIFFN